MRVDIGSTNPELGNHPVHGVDRQPHDVAPRTVDALDEPGTEALDRIGPGLPSRLAAAHVPIDLASGHRRKPHPGRDHLREFLSPCMDNYRGKHVMCRARQQPQHPCRIIVMPRLAENPAIDHNLRVCSDYDGGGIPVGGGRDLRLVTRHPNRVRLCRFAGTWGFFHISRKNLEAESGSSEKLGPSGRGGREYHAHRLILSRLPMQPIQHLAGGVLAQLIRRQPESAARTQFAWQLVVGPALARVTTVALEHGVLHVRAADPRWLKEIERARGAILPKLQHVLGPGAVTKITIS